MNVTFVQKFQQELRDITVFKLIQFTGKVGESFLFVVNPTRNGIHVAHLEVLGDTYTRTKTRRIWKERGDVEREGIGTLLEDAPPEELQEVLLSLSYLPSAERLTVVLLKARNLFLPQDKENIVEERKTMETEDAYGCLGWEGLEGERMIREEGYDLECETGI
uniref:Uncharacterized protein n=1 Tax=Timema douglasi TaxID=61478 RepID=A0A7R8VN05_TIMDO|nr:unnamed protein product [Timema douglasi]